MTGAASPAELVAALERPRAGVGHGPGRCRSRSEPSTELGTLLEPGDTIIDGGNTRYHDDIRRARELAERGIHYVDVGTSGGVFGLERGFCLMVGGEDEVVNRLAPLFDLARAGPRRGRTDPRAAPASLPPRSSAGSTAARRAQGTS